MRTYTRKPPEYKVIDGVHDMCRLCLSKCDEGVPIFTEQNDNVCVALALRIMICVGLEMAKENHLPNKVCTDCLNELNRYYTFRKKCEMTYQKLKSHMLAMKEQEYKVKQKNLNPVLLNGHEITHREFEVSNYVVEFEKYTTEGENQNEAPAEVNLERVDEETTSAPSSDNQETNATGPDISTFLTAMLIEMGILNQQDQGLMVVDETVQSLDLESGDGNQVTFELVEEDETPEEQPESHADAAENLEEIAVENSHLKIQHVESHYTERKSSNANSLCCDICGKQFVSRSAVTRHRRVHTGERPYQCTDCGSTFAQAEIMMRHRLVHAEERPFVCDICGAGFTQRGALASHARSHDPPASRALQLHRCARCPKVFLYKSGLSRHMMAHNGRVYMCGVCDKVFRDKSSLLRHLKNTKHTESRDEKQQET